MADVRQSTGVPRLDSLLGGGLLPGMLTVVAGATGIGKTQLGLHFAQTGLAQEGERGIVFDLTTRGDAQNHAQYANRLFGWPLSQQLNHDCGEPGRVFDRAFARRDYLHVFEQSGRRVTRNDLDPDEWQAWKIELVRKLQLAIEFFYGNFVHGVRRCIIDGVEPTDRPAQSFQFDLFDYVYHQILRKDADWVARDLLRQNFRAQAPQVEQHMYDPTHIGCLLLCTTREIMLDELLQRPLDTGDALANANTIILLGKTRDGSRMGRAMYIAKHRGSFCDDSIVPYELTDRGFAFAP
ncbi:MAG: RAD55 family ATPase [Planctomycetaceae bacterium]